MNKLFTLIMAAAATIGAQAGDFALLFGDTPVEEDVTYERGYTILSADEILTSYEQDANLFIRGTVNDTYEVTVVTDNPVQACPFTDCFNLKSGDIKKISGSLTSELQSLQIHQVTEVEGAHNPADVLKVITVNVSVNPKGDVFSSQNTEVVLRNVPQSEIGSVASIKVNNDYIAMSDSRTLRFNASTPTSLCIYNAEGVKVYSRTVNGTGSIKLNNLSGGLYLYRFNNQKGKFLVK